MEIYETYTIAPDFKHGYKFFIFIDFEQLSFYAPINCETMINSQKRNVLIVGVSEGLGSAMVSRYLKSGCRLLISARNESKLKKIAEEMKAPTQLSYVSTDVSTREGLDVLISSTKHVLKDLDVLVVQVGGYGEDSIADYRMLDSMLESHLKIPVAVISSALSVMTKGSSILLLSSAETLGYPEPEKMSYSIAKTALNRLIESLASQLLSSGIRVNALAPSYINGNAKNYFIGSSDNPPELIAKVVDWITGDDSILVNGSILAVDGGHRFSR